MTAATREAIAALLLDLAEDGKEILVISASRDGGVLGMNGAARAALGAGEGPGAGGRLASLFTEADSRLVAGLLEAEPGRFGPMLLNFAGAGGAPVTARTLLEIGSGVVLAGVRAAAEESLLAEDLVRLNNELAAATRESARRGRELEKALSDLRRAQALLVHQEKMASIGQATAGVAHEINNPLAYVVSNTETLTHDFEALFAFVNAVGDTLDTLRAAVPAEAAAIDGAADAAGVVELAEAIPAKLAASLEGLERIRQIVTDLRTFSRLDEAERKEVDLVESLHATLRFLGPLERDRGVRVETDFPPSLRLHCAPGALNQAVSNIVSNAILASRPGQTVRLRLLSDGGKVTLRAEDDGCGIAAKDLPKVFDPFFTTRGVGEGTGLGLSIAHQVAEAHGGRIEIESEPGRGTCVTVVLPASRGGDR